MGVREHGHAAYGADKELCRLMQMQQRDRGKAWCLLSCIPRPRAATSVASMMGALASLELLRCNTHMPVVCAGISVLPAALYDRG